jgi:hypothetical protein
MGETDRQHARELSMQALPPPLRLPRYEQETFLGKGAFGEVWRAVDSNNGRQVAIKFYNRRAGLDWSLLSREVEKLRYLFSDRYVVQLFDVGWEADPPYYVMEFMEHGSLEDRLQQGPLPVHEAIALFREVVVGLIHAHGKGVLHCDLKPANILLDQDFKPRLADFGQSRLTGEQSPALGTLFYMAPEQADLKAVPDARWDVYALGALLYCMLTGHPPYRTEEGATEIMQPARLEERMDRYRRFLYASKRPTGHRRVAGVDPHLADIIDRCLALEPRARYSNVQAVLTALDLRRTRMARRPLLALGIAAPAMVMIVMALIAAWLFRDTSAIARGQVASRALESNRLAARSIAERFSLEVEKRWRILEQEARNENLRRWLTLGRRLEDEANRETVHKLYAWLRNRHVYWDAHFPEGTKASLWFVDDRAGFQRGCSDETNGFLHRYFGYRDYFHGRGFNLDKNATPPDPIIKPHRSMVYKRLGKNCWTVAFSVPVPDLDRPSSPIGVLGLTHDLGEFTRFKGSRDQFAVLIDVRGDEKGRRGMIVEHPYLDRLAEHPDEPFQPYFSPDVVVRAEKMKTERESHSVGSESRQAGPESTASDFPGDYSDPVGGAFAGRYLATLEPVIIPRLETDVGDTGWVVLVQESYDDAMRPLEGMTTRFIYGASLGFLLVVLAVAGVWGFVIVVMNEGHGPGLLAFLRRKLGLPGTSVTPGGISSISQARSEATRSSGPTSATPVAEAPPQKLPKSEDSHA